MVVSQTEHLSEIAPSLPEKLAARQTLEDTAFQLAQEPCCSSANLLSIRFHCCSVPS